ncbi:sigma factor-like helix-turn-helix DNA-binding protein [Streptomyces sp. NPDC001450]
MGTGGGGGIRTSHDAQPLRGLSPRQRACVVLRYHEDMSTAGVAARLGCGEGTVKRHLSDALARDQWRSSGTPSLRLRREDPGEYQQGSRDRAHPDVRS